MFFRTLRQLFNTLPLYMRVLIVATAVSILLILLVQHEIVSNAVHLLQALPPVLIFPGGYLQSPKGEEAERTVE